MSDSTADNGPLGCLNIGFGLAILGALIVFLQWLWGIMVAAAIWLWLVPGRLLAWILSWPMLSGHLLLGLLAGAAMGVLTWLVFELVLKLIWPHQFLWASTRASGMLKGRYFWWGEEVMQFDFVEFCDHTTNSASIIMNRCLPRKHGQPDCGISIEQVSVEGISVHPGKARLSRRLRILRQPTRTYIESLQRHGIEPLAADSMEAKAWQALLDSEQELTKLAELRESARSMLHDAQRVLQFSADNELLSSTRKRSLALAPTLIDDISRIDARCLELRRFGYKLYEFLNIPKSLRTFELSDDMEATLLAQRGLSDELFEEIKLYEQAYGELLGD